MIWIARYFAGAYIITALWTWVESFSLRHALHNQRTGSLHPSHNSTTASSEPHDLHSFSIYCEPPVSNIMCVSTYLFLFFPRQFNRPHPHAASNKFSKCRSIIWWEVVAAIMAAICLGDRIRCKDGVEGTVIDLHKYDRERHIVIRTAEGEERDLKLSDYCKSWIHLFP